MLQGAWYSYFVLRGLLCNDLYSCFTRGCLRGSVVNSNDPEVKCPFDDGAYTCGAVISEREIRAVSDTYSSWDIVI